MGRRSRHRQRPINLRESATAVLDAPAELLELAEAGTAGALAPIEGARRRYRARLIEGDRWGSSGYYSRAVLERDGPAAFPVGTRGYLDHPSVSEANDRPERSVRDMALRIASTPVYEGDGLYADVEVYPHMQAIVEGLAEDAGLSIRAFGRAEHGEAQGRRGPIVTAITGGRSVDLVTEAGAGGKLLELLESARSVPMQEARTVGAWLESRLHLALTQLADDLYGEGRLTRDERITLSSAIGDGLATYTARIEAEAPQLYQRGPWDEPETGDMAEARLVETTADETRRALDAAVTAAYGGDATRYTWVRDHDPDELLVWFDACDADGDHTWQQSYTVTDDVVALAGERTQVVARTEYEPVGPAGDTEIEPTAAEDTADMAESAATPDVTDGAPPAAPAPPTTSEGSETVTSTVSITGPAPGTAGTATATETSTTSAATVVHTVAESIIPPAADPALLERLTAVEAALTAERARGDQALAEAARLRADGTARDSVTRLLGESTISADLRDIIAPRVNDRVIGRVALTEAGVVDQAALDTAITEAITAETAHAARLLEAQGVGAVRGLGATGSAELPQAKQQERVAAFRRLGLSESAAVTAAAGQIGGTR